MILSADIQLSGRNMEHMDVLLPVLGLVVVVAVIVGIYLWSTYNALVTLNVRVDEAWSDITVQLKRRADLIPNLVEAVKGYAKHEKDVFEKVTTARAASINPEILKSPAKSAKAEGDFQSAMKSLFAVAEAYPQLQASHNFLQLQAQTAHISESATLLEGVQVMHMAVVHSEAVVEDNSIVNTGAIVEHHCVVGASSHIAVGAVLCGNVVVGARTHVGANATILQGVRVGSDCIIGAGAVVLHDVPDNSIAVGVPAVVKSRS